VKTTEEGLSRRELNRIIHQIKNELQKILSYAELGRTEEIKETVESTVGQINTLKGLIKIMLDKIDDL
jgi:hypothetical protein